MLYGLQFTIKENVEARAVVHPDSILAYNEVVISEKEKARRMKAMQTKELLENTVKILDNKKAEDIKALEITDLSSVADYFVIVSGTSSTHIKRLPRSLRKS